MIRPSIYLLIAGAGAVKRLVPEHKRKEEELRSEWSISVYAEVFSTERCLAKVPLY